MIQYRIGSHANTVGLSYVSNFSLLARMFFEYT